MNQSFRALSAFVVFRLIWPCLFVYILFSFFCKVLEIGNLSGLHLRGLAGCMSVDVRRGNLDAVLLGVADAG